MSKWLSQQSYSFSKVDDTTLLLGNENFSDQEDLKQEDLKNDKNEQKTLLNDPPFSEERENHQDEKVQRKASATDFNLFEDEIYQLFSQLFMGVLKGLGQLEPLKSKLEKDSQDEHEENDRKAGISNKDNLRKAKVLAATTYLYQELNNDLGSIFQMIIQKKITNPFQFLRVLLVHIIPRLTTLSQDVTLAWKEVSGGSRKIESEYLQKEVFGIFDKTENKVIQQEEYQQTEETKNEAVIPIKMFVPNLLNLLKKKSSAEKPQWGRYFKVLTEMTQSSRVASDILLITESSADPELWDFLGKKAYNFNLELRKYHAYAALVQNRLLKTNDPIIFEQKNVEKEGKIVDSQKVSEDYKAAPGQKSVEKAKELEDIKNAPADLELREKISASEQFFKYALPIFFAVTNYKCGYLYISELPQEYFVDSFILLTIAGGLLGHLIYLGVEAKLRPYYNLDHHLPKDFPASFNLLVKKFYQLKEEIRIRNNDNLDDKRHNAVLLMEQKFPELDAKIKVEEKNCAQKKKELCRLKAIIEDNASRAENEKKQREEGELYHLKVDIIRKQEEEKEIYWPNTDIYRAQKHKPRSISQLIPEVSELSRDSEDKKPQDELMFHEEIASDKEENLKQPGSQIFKFFANLQKGINSSSAEEFPLFKKDVQWVGQQIECGKIIYPLQLLYFIMLYVIPHLPLKRSAEVSETDDVSVIAEKFVKDLKAELTKLEKEELSLAVSGRYLQVIDSTVLASQDPTARRILKTLHQATDPKNGQSTHLLGSEYFREIDQIQDSKAREIISKLQQNLKAMQKDMQKGVPLIWGECFSAVDKIESSNATLQVKREKACRALVNMGLTLLPGRRYLEGKEAHWETESDDPEKTVPQEEKKYESGGFFAGSKNALMSNLQIRRASSATDYFFKYFLPILFAGTAHACDHLYINDLTHWVYQAQMCQWFIALFHIENTQQCLVSLSVLTVILAGFIGHLVHTLAHRIARGPNHGLPEELTSNFQQLLDKFNNYIYQVTQAKKEHDRLDGERALLEADTRYVDKEQLLEKTEQEVASLESEIIALRSRYFIWGDLWQSSLGSEPENSSSSLDSSSAVYSF